MPSRRVRSLHLSVVPKLIRSCSSEIKEHAVRHVRLKEDGIAARHLRSSLFRAVSNATNGVSDRATKYPPKTWGRLELTMRFEPVVSHTVRSMAMAPGGLNVE